MTTRQSAMSPGRSRQPNAVGAAVVLAIAVGTMTLVGGMTIASTMVRSGFTDGPLIAQLVIITQLVAALLVIIGAIRLAMRAGRTTLIVGTTLQLMVCSAWLLYATFNVARDPIENPTTVTMIVGLSLIFATMLAGSLLLTLTRSTTTYLHTTVDG